MNERLDKITQLAAEGQLLGDCRRSVPLSTLSTWRVGGAANLVTWPQAPADMSAWLQVAHSLQVPTLILGRGSNILLPDAGWDGLVLCTTKMKQCEWQKDQVIAQAGVSLPQLARAAADKGLSGLEFASGIPGTLGGSLITNAGAYGRDMGTLVVSATVCSADGSWEDWQPLRLGFSYRHSSLSREHTVVQAVLQLQPATRESIEQEMRRCEDDRRRKQPLNSPTAGSVFRNPPGGFAGRLIEEAGWKGRSLGGAQVSALNANFIINTGAATAAEIAELITRVQEDVQQKLGVHLETEVRIP